MASLQKNVASQNFTFCLINATSGAGVSGATVTGFVTKDGAVQATAGGTVTSQGNGQYNYAPLTAETNATDVGFLFTATGCIPCNLDFHTDQVDANGFLKVDLVDVAGSAVTTGTAQIGVNLVNVAGSAVTTGTAQIGVNVVQYNAQTAQTDANNLPKVDTEDWKGTAVSAPATAGIPDVNVKNINNVAAATPGAAGGVLIAGVNAATTFNGTAASGATAATPGVTITGGAASATSGGTAAAGMSVTGGAGAASVNGAAPGETISAGGTTTVSGNDGVQMTGTGNGNGLVLSKAGTGIDFKATSTNSLQVNAVQINGVSAGSVSAINANIGTTQPVNFTGTSTSALVKADMIDVASAAVTTGTAQIGVNVVNVGGSAVTTGTAQIGVNVVNIAGAAAAVDANNLLKVDVEDINGNATAAQNVSKANQAIGRGTCTSGGSTTNILTSSFAPTIVASGQLNGRTVIFDANTTTSSLQGQATNITGCTAGSFTVTALTTAPVNGDTFSVV